MNKLTKKLIVIAICLTFLISAVGSSTAVTINNKKTTNEEAQEVETITLYRFGPDGSVDPIELDIDLEGEQDLMEAISEKCDELLENDFEMQNFLNSLENGDNDSVLKIGLWTKVTSWGRGFHFKSKIHLFSMIVRKIIDVVLPLVNIKLFRPFVRPTVFCSYRNDSRAKTTLKPLLGSNNATRVIEGNHTLLIRQFIGFALWSGSTDILSPGLAPRLVHGRARFVICSKL